MAKVISFYMLLRFSDHNAYTETVSDKMNAYQYLQETRISDYEKTDSPAYK